jgi:polyhydroxybutyrate depolymerase
MRRALAAAAACVMLACGAAGAQQFDGRALLITDGRADAEVASPLVVVLHGLTGSGAIMRHKTGFAALARTNGFVVAYPNGHLRRWRDSSGSADVAYLTHLIDALHAQYGTDPARVYLVGYSNGGTMAMRMSCTVPARIRAISVVAMTQPRDTSCANTRPVPALFIHGALDPVVPAAGLAPRHHFGGLMSLENTLAHWAARNGCRKPGAVATFDQVAGPDAARITQFSGCTAPLTAAVLTGQGHDWPGAAQYLPFLLGPASRELDAAAFSWRFFETAAGAQ